MGYAETPTLFLRSFHLTTLVLVTFAAQRNNYRAKIVFISWVSVFKTTFYKPAQQYFLS